MIEIISGTWAAGELKTFHINGEYLEVLDAQYPLDIMLMDKTGAQLSIMNNSEASFFSRPKEGFNTVQIKSTQAQFIRIFVGSGDAGTRRISSTVQVIDGERQRTNAGVMFTASCTASGGAATFPLCQLWNPVGSGKRLVLGAVGVGSPVSMSVNIWSAVAAATTDISANFILNKLLGSAVGAAQVRVMPAAALPTTSGFGVTIPAYGYVPWKPTGVIVVSPGVGVNFAGGVVNQALTVNLEWFEEAI